jgi:hypothetical protein
MERRNSRIRYPANGPLPWFESHISDLMQKMDWMPKREWDALARGEIAKLDRLGEVMRNTKMDYYQAERQVYGDKSGYYAALDKEISEKIARLEKKIGRKKEAGGERKRAATISETNFPERNFYLEGELTSAMKDRLEGIGFKRLKVSPFGDTGAAYYFVRTRYNESKEHAFFCFLIESELKKRGGSPEMFINNGPDLEFSHNDRTYCIDVETGTNLARDKERVTRKFGRYRVDYYCSYIFVTSKKLKHKYNKYGVVLTRASLLKALDEIMK